MRFHAFAEYLGLEETMTWKFEKVAGPYKGRTGGLSWDGKNMLFSAGEEEGILRFDSRTGKADVFRNYTRRTNGLGIPADGSGFRAQGSGRRIIQFLEDRSNAPS